MVIREILKLATDLLEETRTLMETLNYKTYEYETLMFRAEEINKIITEIESCLHIPGFEDKLDYREDIPFYLDSLRHPLREKKYEVLGYVEKYTANTVLWAKKLSWFGDWDFNLDGQHTLMSVVFENDAAVKDYEIPHYFFHNAGKLTNKNYKLEIKSPESKLKSLRWINFSKDWETIEFQLEENKEVFSIKGKVFKWDKAKFGGMTFDRPFYAERTTKFFGEDHIIYNQFDSQD